MKIGEVKVGTEYAASDRYSRYERYPRRVKALEIVTVEEPWYDRVTGVRKVRNVKKVKVQALGPATGGRFASGISGVEENATTNVEARHLVALWSEVRPGIQKQEAEAVAQNAKEKEVEKRVSRLLGPRSKRGCYVYGRRGTVELTHLEGKELDKLLTLAEAGLAARGS